jgi:ATP-dependent helicase/nuclease subunit B
MQDPPMGARSPSVPESGLLRAAAREVVAREAGRLPDLSEVVILLPTLHAADALGRALCAEAKRDVLLLPRITTLRCWTGESTGSEVLSDSRREAMLYQVLRDGQWFPQADLWQVAGELRVLADELTRWRVTLPDSPEDFAARLEQAYRASGNASLRFEARLVHEMWFALARDAAARDREAVYKQRLAALAQCPRGPLYAVGLEGLAPAEEAFLSAYAQGMPVRRIDSAPAEPVSVALRAAWPESAASPLRERAARMRSDCPQSPLKGRFALFAARSLEQEAQAVDLSVRRWLLAGKTRVAVVAQDRLVARRARALLERAAVLVEDETGWTLSTASASTVIRRWLDCLASQFYHLDLLDLLKSPFLLADWPASQRKDAVYGLEQLMRKHGIVSHLDRYVGHARRADGLESAVALLERLDAARATLSRRPRSLATWTGSLLESLDRLGVRQGLARDMAGRQLLELLQRLANELGSDDGHYDLNEWKRWLFRQLESATFRDTRVESPVVFTHLANTRLRAFDAVVIAGADAARLPGNGGETLFFNQAVREDLGLPGHGAELARTERDLIDLIAGSGEVLVTWRAVRDGEPSLLSPWFERLEAFHQLAWGEKLADDTLAELIAALGSRSGERYEFTRCPAPSLPETLVPRRVSASSYNSLLVCPYQYFARHALRLNELDEVQEGLEKRDYGEYIHTVLHRFHERHPAVSGQDDESLRRQLEEITDRVFGEAVDAHYLSRAWALRWKALIPAYLGWQRQREAQGWRVAEREEQRQRPIRLEGGQDLTLMGRLDRVDESEGGLAVLDYKAQGADRLKRKLSEPGEDVQLPVYALLAGEGATAAAFVSLDRDEVKDVPLEQDPLELGEAVESRLAEMFEALHRGASLRAQGVPEECQWCEMRGLCRKDYWQ